MLASVVVSCGGGDGSTAPKDAAWTEEEVTFSVGPNTLNGILTLPDSEGPHSAVVIASGSESREGSIQSGVTDAYFADLAHRLAGAGYAAFRYDSKGVGSRGDAGLQTLDAKRDEVIAALRRVRRHSSIRADEVGLWGISQEAWTISMAAAAEPDEVAFIIPVSGAGISVAEQQVWGIEAQSRAAGLQTPDIERATLLGGLLVDWQLTEPLFHDANEKLVAKLGAGPWQDFFTLVYDSDALGPAENLSRGITILTSIKDEPWAQALHLEELYLPRLRSVAPEQIEQLKAASGQSLLIDPRDSLTRVTSPVLAFFGEDDIVQPTDRSAKLYAQYLDEAGNDDVTIVILQGVGHDISPSSPGYWDRLVQWLDER
ncbi:MAG TPA: CocE/NonD family hydrolase [Gaiellaceae bacterium]|nr:CocE/NonD family hydrolase [Gaiellaceae bacterium]